MGVQRDREAAHPGEEKNGVGWEGEKGVGANDSVVAESRRVLDAIENGDGVPE